LTVFGFEVPKGIFVLFLCAGSVAGCSSLSIEDPLAAVRSPETSDTANSETAKTAFALQSSDQSFADKSLQAALEKSVSGKSVTWINPASGAQGSVTPLKTWKNDQGAYCRSYSEWIRPASGNSIRRRGIACRSDQAVWKAA